MKKGEIPLRNFPFLVHRPQAVSLFDALQPRTPSFWARGFRRRLLRVSFGYASINEFAICPIFFTVDFKRHSGTIFPRIDRGNAAHRNRQLSGDTAETRLKLDKIVPDQQLVGSSRAKIENDLAIPDKLAGHASPLININRDVRSKAVVAAPLPDGTQQVGLGRRKSHAYLRIAFSDGVSASMKPWRLNMRSAYFINGAAALPRSIP